MEDFVQLITSLASSYVPIADNTLRTQVAITVGTIAKKIAVPKALRTFIWWGKWFKKNNEVIIFNRNNDNTINPIYYKLEEYFVKTFAENVQAYQLVLTRGEIQLSIYNTKKSTIFVEFENNTIEVKFNLQRTSSSAYGSGSNNDSCDDTNNYTNDDDNTRNKSIVLSSKSSDVNLITRYIQYVCSLKVKNSILTIYRSVRIQGPPKRSRGRNSDNCDADGNATVNWDALYVKTNKTKENTIYSQDVEREFFDDIDWFMKNEEWFAKRGIPYKRGYVCYGFPGSGKSSISKILANQYEIPIFAVNMNTISSDSDIIHLSTEINYLAQNDKYILLFEDIDKCELFTHRYRENTHLSIECFLNILDGVVETHGRILIMTANNIQILEDVPALLRPGRIDKKIQFGYCTEEQVRRLILLFFPDIDMGNTPVNIKITPAELVQIMQLNHGTPEVVLEKVSEKKVLQAVEPSSSSIFNDAFGAHRRRRYQYRRQTVAFKKQKIKHIENQAKNLDKLKKMVAKQETQQKLQKERQVEQNKKRKEREQKQKKIEQEKRRKLKSGDMILNPVTGKLVKKDGMIGKFLQKVNNADDAVNADITVNEEGEEDDDEEKN